MLIFLIPFIAQSVIILIDEVYFHLKRGLPRWERIGHPLDTFSLLACLFVILFVPFSLSALKLYSALAILSCVMVTKDEFVHKHHCPAAENWVHAFLFILHPIVLAICALFWPSLYHVNYFPWITAYLPDPPVLRLSLILYTSAIFLFFIYQIVFWNFIWKKKA